MIEMKMLLAPEQKKRREIKIKEIVLFCFKYQMMGVKNVLCWVKYQRVVMKKEMSVD